MVAGEGRAIDGDHQQDVVLHEPVKVIEHVDLTLLTHTCNALLIPRYEGSKMVIHPGRGGHAPTATLDRKASFHRPAVGNR